MLGVNRGAAHCLPRRSPHSQGPWWATTTTPCNHLALLYRHDNNWTDGHQHQNGKVYNWEELRKPSKVSGSPVTCRLHPPRSLYLGPLLAPKRSSGNSTETCLKTTVNVCWFILLSQQPPCSDKCLGILLVSKTFTYFVPCCFIYYLFVD